MENRNWGKLGNEETGEKSRTGFSGRLGRPGWWIQRGGALLELQEAERGVQSHRGPSDFHDRSECYLFGLDGGVYWTRQKKSSYTSAAKLLADVGCRPGVAGGSEMSKEPIEGSRRPLRSFLSLQISKCSPS